MKNKTKIVLILCTLCIIGTAVWFVTTKNHSFVESPKLSAKSVAATTNIAELQPNPIRHGGSGAAVSYGNTFAEITSVQTRGAWNKDYSGRRNSSMTNYPTTEKIIQSGSVSLSGANPLNGWAQFKNALIGLGGVIKSEEISTPSYDTNIRATVLIPADKWEKIWDLPNKELRLISKSINTENVNDEWIDLEADLNSKRNIEQRFFELSKRANSVSDLLQIEQELNRVRTDIDRAQGRLQTMNRKIQYSELSININSQATTIKVYKQNGMDKMTDAFKFGTQLFWIIGLGLIKIWPILLLLTLVFLVLRKKLFSHQKHKDQGI